MRVQNKTIVSGFISSFTTGSATTLVTHAFSDETAVNVHGMTITQGCSPFGPDETLVGRWYLVNLPPSVAEDSTVRNAWQDQLNTIGSANSTLDNAQFIWASGTVVCSDKSTFQQTLSLKSTRNMLKGSELALFVVVDAISGVIDDFDWAGTMTFFTSS